MKKILCTLLVLIASVVSAYSQDALTAKDVTIPKGGSALLEIDLTNVKPYSAFEFSIKLPAGITLPYDNTEDPDMEEIQRWAIGIDVANRVKDNGISLTKLANLSDPTNNVFGFVIFSMEGKKVPVGSGAVFYITLNVDDSYAPGTELEGEISKILLSTANNDDKSTPDGSTFKITIDEPDDGRLKFYETSEILPSYTAGNSYDVTLFRTINKDEWSTIVLPFNLPKQKADAAFGADAKYYTLSGFETTVDFDDNMKTTGIKLIFSQYELKNNLMALTGGKPYLIKTNKDITEIKADNVKTVANVDPTNVTDVVYSDMLGGFFNGTFIKRKIPTDGLFLSGNKFWYSTGNTTVKGYRAWFDLDVVLDKDIELGSRITMSFEDPTGINEVSVQEDDRYYNLSGQQVKPEKKGLYIQNGKKKIIK